MNFTHFSSKNSIALLTISTLILLPSCTDWFNQKLGGNKKVTQEPTANGLNMPSMPADKKDVLAWINDKPLVTVDSLQEKKNEIIESNPQIKQMIVLIGENQFDKQLTDGIVSQSVVDKYIVDNGIDKSAEYMKEYNRMLVSIKQMLNTKFFSEKLDAQVSDNEAKEFYEKNKDEIPDFLISQGGTKASGVRFNTQQEADAFATKVRTNKNDQSKTATAEKLADKVVNFNFVNDKTPALQGDETKTLNTKIMAMKVPSTEVVKLDNKTFWVVTASEKEERKYRPFDSLKDDLKKYLEKDKRAKALEEKITDLKKQYNVTIQEEHFAPAQKEAEMQPEDFAVEEVEETIHE